MVPFRASLLLLLRLASLLATSREGALEGSHADSCSVADAQEASRHVSLLQTSLGMDEVASGGFASNAAASTGVEAATENEHDGDHRIFEVLANAKSEIKSEPAPGAELTKDKGVVVRLREPVLAATSLKASNEVHAKMTENEIADEVRHIATHRRATHHAATSSSDSDGLGTGVVVAIVVVSLFVLSMVFLFAFDLLSWAAHKEAPRNSRWAGPNLEPSQRSPILSTQALPSSQAIPSPNPPGRSPAPTTVKPSVPYPSGGSLPSTDGVAENRSSLVLRKTYGSPTATGVLPLPLPSGADAAAAAPMAVVPPICPSLILPRTEARFLLSMESLSRSTSGKLDIKGTSGRPLMHAAQDMTPEGRRRLTLASVGCEDDPRTVVVSGAAPSSPLEIYGRGNVLYGTLQPAVGNSTLLYQGRPVMKIEYGPPADLCMSAFAMDGSALGVGQGGAAGGQDQWKLQVKPGQDAVLMTSCMLALILFCPR